VFEVDDVVMVRVQMNSEASADKVAKISYRRRGPYVVVSAEGNGAYLLRKFGSNEDSPTVKHMGENIDLLPPSILPCEPIDAADQRFLDMHYAPKLDPFKKHFGIEGYNVHWFDEKNRPKAVPLPTLDNAVAKDGLVTEDTSEEEKEEKKTVVKRCGKREKTPQSGVQTLREAISASRDRLFFIAYRHPNTLRPRWHLVQVDLEQTDRLPESERKSEGMFYCHFFFPPDKDEKTSSDPDCRWWPIWHEYRKEGRLIVYGSQVRITPNRIPNPDKYQVYCLGRCCRLGK
jgi:hypothetical protein